MFESSNVTLMVADMNRAVAFYTEVLGFTLAERHGDAWAEVEGPGIRIGLHPAPAEASKIAATGRMSIGLQVKDLEATMAALEARGVSFSPVHGDGPVRLTDFRDPDGTPLYLVQAVNYG